VTRRVAATRVIAVAATARSGSTLLCRALAATGELGDPQELVNPHSVLARGSFRRAPFLTTRLYAGLLRNWWRPGLKWMKVHRYGRAPIRAMLDDSVARWGSGDGVLCAKLMWHPYRIAMLEQGVDMNYWGVPVTWVRIQRTDRVRQAVSLVRATQTEQWEADRRAVAEPLYDREAIAQGIARIGEIEVEWDRYLASIGVEPYNVVYEQLDADFEGTMRSLLDHLGYPALEVEPRPVRRQADELNEEWVRRYLAEALV